MCSMNPISDRAVLDGERQQEQRNRLAVGTWLPAVRPWDGTPSKNRFETEAIDGVGSWLESGDMDAVKKWLTFFLEGRDDWRELLAAIHKDIEAARLEALEREALLNAARGTVAPALRRVTA